MELDQRLFRNYIEHKREALVDTIEEGMKTGLFEWDSCEAEPTDVRSYVREILLTLVTIHCEVNTNTHHTPHTLINTHVVVVYTVQYTVGPMCMRKLSVYDSNVCVSVYTRCCVQS